MRLRGRLGRWAKRLALTCAGLALGAAMVPLDLAFVFLAGPALLVGPLRAAVDSGARALAGLHRRRIAYFLGDSEVDGYDGNRALTYVSLRWSVGLLGGFVLFLLAFGLAVAGSMLAAWWFGFPWAAVEDAGRVTWETVAIATIPGVVLLYLNLAGIAGVAGLDRRLARHVLGPNRQELMARRISRLAETRAEVVEAVNDERRRIERDLHDGVQQRLVSLGMLIGRARRTGDSELLRAAHEESQRALEELREVSWRVFPAALAGGGLPAALEVVADRSLVPVRLSVGLAERPSGAVETAAYFVVCEAVTNAAKHAGADEVRVSVTRQENAVMVRVEDDGKGGADPAGGGLSGLARRVEALDGQFTVSSPAGGPTVIAAELPCG
ncbi:sensor histidine kinase [Flindersiella endophytica]